MQQIIEKQIVLPRAAVQLATINWNGVGKRLPHPSYSLFQRLSEDLAPLRIGNFTASELLPRMNSVGFLPAGRSIMLLPIEKPLRVLYCFYDADYLEQMTSLSAQQWEAFGDTLVNLKNQRLEILMQDIQAELEQPGFASEALIESLTNILLVELARHVRQLEDTPAKQPEPQALAHWQLRKIEERIQAAATLGYPSVSELASLCSISESHLARSFKAATGWAIHKFVGEERLKKAKKLLAEGHRCAEVSSQLGFKSPAYFSTVFRRMTGQTPSEFQRRSGA